MRYDELEMPTGCGVVLSDGMRVKMDAGEQRTMKQGGTAQTGQFMRRTIALHLERNFTDVMATDGSKAGRRAAWGLWEGPAPRDGGWAAPETHAGTAARVAAGMAGGRLPDGYDVMDAELAAIVAALEKARARDEGGGDEDGRRVLICTDSQSAMKLLERVWKKGVYTYEREDRVGLAVAANELRREISRRRAGTGRAGSVSFVYTPGHRGIACNSIADAVAKTYLGGSDDGGVLRQVERHAWHVRPYLYGEERDGRFKGVSDRRVSTQVRHGIMGWVRARVACRSENGIVAGAEGKVWGGVISRVGRGAWAMEAARTEGEDDEQAEAAGSEEEGCGACGEGADGDGEQRRDERAASIERRRGRVEVTYGMRTGEVKDVAHGAHWARCRAGEEHGGRHARDGKRGCPAGCGVPCTVQHVVCGECVACAVEGQDAPRGEQAALREMLAALGRVNEEMARVWARKERSPGEATRERWAAGGDTWRRELRLAKQAVARSIGSTGLREPKVTAKQAEWAALRRVLGGILPEPAGLAGWSEREAKAKEGAVAEAVGCVQDVAYGMLERWRERTKEARARRAQQVERDLWEASVERGWRMKKKARGQTKVERRECKWEQDGIWGVNAVRWLQGGEGGGEGWDYFVRTTTGDVGWARGGELVAYLQDMGAWGGELHARMELLRAAYAARMEAKGRPVGRENGPAAGAGKRVRATAAVGGEGDQTWLDRAGRMARKNRERGEAAAGLALEAERERGECATEERGRAGWNEDGARARLREAVRAGAAVGVCGVIRRVVGTVDGKGPQRTCDFITEYIAPGGGKGARGAGTRMLGRVAVALGREADESAARGVHGHVWGQNKQGREFWEGVGMHVAPTVAWDAADAEARVYEVEEGGDWEYMRGDWGVMCGRVAERLEQHDEEEPTTSMAVFNTLEDLRGEIAVHAAVVAAVRRVHDVGAGGDGASVQAVMGETAEQRRDGRIRYVVVAEAARDGEGAGAEAGGSAGGERGAAHGEGEHGADDGGGGEEGGVPMLPVVGGARDRESSRARGEMMPQVTLTRAAGGRRVKRTIIKKR